MTNISIFLFFKKRSLFYHRLIITITEKTS